MIPDLALVLKLNISNNSQRLQLMDNLYLVFPTVSQQVLQQYQMQMFFFFFLLNYQITVF